MTGLEEFVRQSNAIEGIFRTAYSDEIAAHEELLALPRITVLDGGPAIRDALESLLARISDSEVDSWRAHLEYETLHPFMDGNGRSGRTIWLWMRQGNQLPPLSFLQAFYYQTLGEPRS